ncbi:hypothetical protein QUF76_02865 [Desulfobacterales bacterium HSG16]|nr:hypothetical protein [Desulfobacterales bacterium HSG16]
MPHESHDHNFKNLLLDFPEEALEWILPQARQKWGTVRHVEFVREEPKKRRLADSNLILDMPILFSFDNQQLLLWLMEFQDDKLKFSIYKLLIYTAELMEAYPKALVVPTVLFTDRKKWRKDVMRRLETRFNDKVFLQFEYLFIKLFDLNARDYYHVPNPVVKILLPKMKYTPEERWEVIRQAYIGLFQLAGPMLFDKYSDFIDIYAEVREEERCAVLGEIREHKENVMIMQMIKEEMAKEVAVEATITVLDRMLQKKYHLSPESLTDKLKGMSSELLLDLSDHIMDCNSLEEIELWIREQKQSREV